MERLLTALYIIILCLGLALVFMSVIGLCIMSFSWLFVIGIVHGCLNITMSIIALKMMKY